MATPLWIPNQQRINSAKITKFSKHLAHKYSLDFSTYDKLHRWSVQQAESFWAEVWEFSQIVATKKWDVVLENSGSMLDAKWFVGARLNFAENLLRYRDDQPALIFGNERGQRQVISYKELYSKVAALAAYLKSIGLGINDRVVGFVPNIIESVIAMLASTSIGAIWSSCSPDFGLTGIVDRFGQIQPKVLFCADGYFYNGKEIDCLERVKQVIQTIPSIQQIVVIPYTTNSPELTHFNKTKLFTEAINDYSSATEIVFEQLPFDHPLYIMYSSGTTGKPKCIVHGAGGTLIQHLKEHLLHTDLSRLDKIFYHTTCGWMMWNWLISSLAVGSTIMLYDGSPFYPDGNILFDYAEREKITVFGTSAKYLSAVEKAGLQPGKTHNLSNLKTIISTGSALLPESFNFVYQQIKQDVCLSSISGGTDIISCFALGNPTLPVYSGELQVLGLGMNIKVFDQSGNSVIGHKGELVCTKAFPCMPIYFWNDPTGEKYHNAYFDIYPNIWRHGDWAEITSNGGMIIYGRSDATLNPGGIRIGTAEIYHAVEQLSEVAESLAVGQQWKGDERIILFVRLQQGYQLDQELKVKIVKTIQLECSPKHKPAKIIAIPEIPKTISGKIVELAVKNIIHNKPVPNKDALANPQALDYFVNLTELSQD